MDQFYKNIIFSINYNVPITTQLVDIRQMAKTTAEHKDSYHSKN